MRSISSHGVSGTVGAPSSKSLAQRAIFAAHLAGGSTRLTNVTECQDTNAAIVVVDGLGSMVQRLGTTLAIEGRNEPWVANRGGDLGKCLILNCGESGLCFRMAAAIASLYRNEIELVAEGSLRSRPISMVIDPLSILGAEVASQGGFPPLRVKGPIRGGEVQVDGSVSSQFISGLLMALPLCEADSLLIVKDLKSKPYVELTISLLNHFGIEVAANDSGSEFVIPGRQRYVAKDYAVEGDWSAAAGLLVAGALAGELTLTNLNCSSKQADMAVLNVLRLAGAKVECLGSAVKVANGAARAFEFDATDSPDLIPVIVTLASACCGTSRIHGATRLTVKESDRGLVLCEELGKLGVSMQIEGDLIEVYGGQPIHGGKVSSHGDHRIAMACALAGLLSEEAVMIEGDEAVAKSYPKFFDDLATLQPKSGSCRI